MIPNIELYSSLHQVELAYNTKNHEVDQNP